MTGRACPGAGDLPPSLAKLVRRQALELSPSRFDFDTGRLLRVLDSALAEAHARLAGTEPALPVPSGPARHDTGTHLTNVSALTPGEAAATPAPVAESPGPDTAEIQEAREAPGSRVRRILSLRAPRRRAAVLIGLGVVVVTAGTITAVLTTQTSSTTGAGHTVTVSSVAFSRDGTILASAYGNTVRLWNPATRKQIGQPLKGQRSQLFTVAISPNGKVVASGGYDQNLQLWDTATYKPIGQPLGLQNSRMNSVAFSPDGRFLASGDDDGTVLVRELATVKTVKIVKIVGNIDARSTVFTVAFRPDSKILASGSQDGKMRLWDAATRRAITTLNCQAPVLSIAFSHDSKTLACGTEASRVILWTTATHQHNPLSIPVCGGWVDSVAFSPVRNIFAAACGNVRLWDSDSGQPIGKPM